MEKFIDSLQNHQIAFNQDAVFVLPVVDANSNNFLMTLNYVTRSTKLKMH